MVTNESLETMIDHIGMYSVPYVDDDSVLQNKEETVLVMRNGAYFRLLSDEEKNIWKEYEKLPTYSLEAKARAFREFDVPDFMISCVLSGC